MNNFFAIINDIIYIVFRLFFVPILFVFFYFFGALMVLLVSLLVLVSTLSLVSLTSSLRTDSIVGSLLVCGTSIVGTVTDSIGMGDTGFVGDVTEIGLTGSVVL